jgi:quercetin dioxygenase-like cupin family protein
MWRRQDPHALRSDLFGGSGVVRVWSSTPSPIAPFRVVLACELEPSASVGEHVQVEFPELVIVVSGTGSARVGGEARALESGAVVELPLGQTLSLENSSATEPLRYFIVKAGNDPESFRS